MALIALCLQKRFDKRPDKTSHMLPASAVQPGGNHRAVWLGGGGVGKTWTLQKVVEPLAVTFFGNNGYAAAAQSNHAAQNLGARGRTLHSANGLLMTDSLQTARLCLSERTRKKLDRLTGEIGVDVIDELGCVPGDLLHADALRKTYGRALRYNIDPTAYLKPQETWGWVPCKLLSGDFLQLPPVPASASLLAPPEKQSYEHLLGRKILMDMEYVVDFVQMQRFDDPVLVAILEAMRTRGGKKISDEAWRAIESTRLHTAATGSAVQPAASRKRRRTTPSTDTGTAAASGTRLIHRNRAGGRADGQARGGHYQGAAPGQGTSGCLMISLPRPVLRRTPPSPAALPSQLRLTAGCERHGTGTSPLTNGALSASPCMRTRGSMHMPRARFSSTSRPSTSLSRRCRPRTLMTCVPCRTSPLRRSSRESCPSTLAWKSF